MIREFNKNFGITTSIEDEKKAFINRIDTFLLGIRSSSGDYEALYSTVCLQLGLNGKKINDNNPFDTGYIPDLNSLLPKGFLNTLKIIIAVRKYYKDDFEMVSFIDEAIDMLINMATVDLGITYKSGMFFPKGEEVLDKELIGYSLKSLIGFPNENKDLQNALDNYKANSKYGVIENCYRCIEGLMRQILKNNKTLIDNKSEIIRSIGLSEHWKKILANYIDYGNEYGRHASEKRHDFNQAEVEAYLYTTCILIRLIVELKGNAHK